jgi:hypothetical protein
LSSVEDLTGLDGIGQAAAGKTMQFTDDLGIEYLTDLLTFRSSNVATFLITGYQVDAPMEVTVQELDRLVDFLATLTDESFKPRVPDELPSGMLPVHNNDAPDSAVADDGARIDE